MKYIVVNNFDDGETQGVKGQEYKGGNADALLKAGLIEAAGKAEKAPKDQAPKGDDPGEGGQGSDGDEPADYEAMTKAELGAVLTEKGIEFKVSATKAELIELLQSQPE